MIFDLLRREMKYDWKSRHFLMNPFRHLLYRHRWGAWPKNHKQSHRPLSVDVEFANGCNFRCIMCQQSTNWLKKKDESFMSWDTLREVVSQCKGLGVDSMKVNWRGEPTLDSECAEKIQYIKGQGIHEVQMNTNASKLTPSLADALIKSGLDRIMFSCDGLSKETYNKIRRGGNFDTFVKNITMFRQRRNAIDATRGFFNPRRGLPRIRLNMAVMQQNYHEVANVEEFFKTTVDEFKFNTVYQPQNSNLNQGQSRQDKIQGCPQIWQRLIIDVHGNIMPCCVDFREKLKMGNIHKTTIEYVWMNRVRAIRFMHENHQARDLKGCAKCDNFALSEKDKNGKVVWK